MNDLQTLEKANGLTRTNRQGIGIMAYGIFLLFLVLTVQPLAAFPGGTDDDSEGSDDEQAVSEERYYSLTSLPAPEETVLEVGGLALTPDGRLAAATRRGDIWLISNPSMEGGTVPYYQRFARGLYEPLGLIYKEGGFYTSQRGELNRLEDTTGDGRVNRVERVGAWPLSAHYHEYTFGPALMPDGSMIVTANVSFGRERWWEAMSEAPWRGWAMRITPDGEIDPIATGLRSPAGVTVNSKGDILYTENEGDWIGSGFLAHIEEGDFFGNPAGLRWADRPESPVEVRREDIVDSERPMYEAAERVPGIKLPAVWIPHTLMGISTSDILEAEDDSFGPYKGHYFVGDQGHARINRVVMEKVNGAYQGVAFPFRSNFDSGVLRMIWGEPGSMYVGMTDRGWSSSGSESYGIQRVQWSGEVPFEMREVRAMPDGFEIEFTQPVDRQKAVQPGAFLVNSFNYMYRYDYGSPIIRQESGPVQGVRVSDDGYRVRLVVENMREKYVHEVRLGDLTAENGTDLLHSVGYYTLNNIPEGPSMSESEWTVRFDPEDHAAHEVTTPLDELDDQADEEADESFETAERAKRVTEMPESWENGPDQTIRLGTRPDLRFDIESIEVEAGSNIELIFENDDTMLHNVVVVMPGTADEVGEEALELGLRGDEMNYVPENENVLFYTAIVQPGRSETIYFQAPEIPDTYTYVCTFPGHHVPMRGELIVR